jgi:FkbM family methyltransferase
VEPFTLYGDGFRTRYFPSRVDTIGQRLFWTGLREWEKETVEVFLGLLRRARSFLDVGANCGIYPLLACAVNRTIEVVAVEPVPAVFAALENNVRFNNLTSRVGLLRAAISDQEGMVPFHESEDPTMGSLDVGGYRGKAGKVIEVRATTLDLIADGMSIPPDLIKIDVEGFEDKVLSGAHRTLAVHRPKLIVEANPDGPYRRLTQILSEHSYEFFHLTEAGPVRKPAIEPDAQSVFRNWLCAPLAPNGRG